VDDLLKNCWINNKQSGKWTMLHRQLLQLAVIIITYGVTHPSLL
jgi:hypothetical protein